VDGDVDDDVDVLCREKKVERKSMREQWHPSRMNTE
jgi:hypothetical protein